MSGFERPAPEAEKIVTAWKAWTAGEDALPGRTMADLKIAGVDRLLAELSAGSDDAERVAAVWQQWEKGRVGPSETLAALADGGFGTLVEALAAAE